MQHSRILKDGAPHAEVLVLKYWDETKDTHHNLRDHVIDDAVMSIGEGESSSGKDFGNERFGRYDHDDQREHEPGQHDAAPVTRPPLREALPERRPRRLRRPLAPGDDPGASGAIRGTRSDGGEAGAHAPVAGTHAPVAAFRPRLLERLAHHDPSRHSPSGPAQMDQHSGPVPNWRAFRRP